MSRASKAAMRRQRAEQYCRSSEFCPHGKETRYECYECGLPPDAINLESSSYHEAGHALFAILANIPIDRVTARPHWQKESLSRPATWVRGVCQLSPEFISSSQMFGYLKQIAAGDIVQAHLKFKCFPDPTPDPTVSYMSWGDARQFICAIKQVSIEATCESVCCIYTEIATSVRNDLSKSENLEALRAIAELLQERETASGNEIMALLSIQKLHTFYKLVSPDSKEKA